MVEGSKSFYLIDPSQNERLYEGNLRQAYLKYNFEEDQFYKSVNQLDDSVSLVMSPIDLDQIDYYKFPKFKSVKRILNCTATKGDVIFIPAYHWHHVISKPQPNKEKRRNIAVNFWFKPLFSKLFPCSTCRRTLNLKDYNQFFEDHFLEKHLEEISKDEL